MKKFKLLIGLLAFLIISITLVSCNKDNGEGDFEMCLKIPTTNLIK